MGHTTVSHTKGPSRDGAAAAAHQPRGTHRGIRFLSGHRAELVPEAGPMWPAVPLKAQLPELLALQGHRESRPLGPCIGTDHQGASPGVGAVGGRGRAWGLQCGQHLPLKPGREEGEEVPPAGSARLWASAPTCDSTAVPGSPPPAPGTYRPGGRSALARLLFYCFTCLRCQLHCHLRAPTFLALPVSDPEEEAGAPDTPTAHGSRCVWILVSRTLPRPSKVDASHRHFKNTFSMST